MISLAQLKKGFVIMHNNDAYQVFECAHHKQGRGGAVLKTKLKNIKTGAVIDHTFQGNDKIEKADLSRKKVQFLYTDEDAAYFMDEQYEQFSLDKDALQDALLYLKEGQKVDAQYLDNKPIAIQLPPKVILQVKEAPPAVKGDTANNPAKTAILETGLSVQVPMFVNTGEIIRVNTETGEYVERVS